MVTRTLLHVTFIRALAVWFVFDLDAPGTYYVA